MNVRSPTRPCPASCFYTRSTQISGERFAALRAAVPTGGRRSKPSPRFSTIGDMRFRCAPRSGADRRSIPFRASLFHGADSLRTNGAGRGGLGRGR